MSALTRTANIGSATTSTTHNFNVGDYVIISGSTGVPLLTTTGDIAASSNTLLNVVSITGVNIGSAVTGTGIPADTAVTGISGVGPFTVTMSNQATATNVGATIDFLEVLNGAAFQILTTATTTSFTFSSFGPDGTVATPGVARVERVGLSASGSKISLTDAQLNTGILGPNIFDQNAAFVLSSLTADIQQNIQAGKIVKTLSIGANSIPDEAGQVVFDFGTEQEEGPVRYFFKPSPNTLALDPAFVFEFDHVIGSAVTMIRRKGPHTISTSAKEFPPYVTDTAIAREILQELILSVKSVGVFVKFLIRFPQQLFATIDVYRSGDDPG